MTIIGAIRTDIALTSSCHGTSEKLGKLFKLSAIVYQIGLPKFLSIDIVELADPSIDIGTHH